MILIFTGKAFISFLDVENAYVEVEGYKYLLVSAPMVFFSFFNFGIRVFIIALGKIRQR